MCVAELRQLWPSTATDAAKVDPDSLAGPMHDTRQKLTDHAAFAERRVRFCGEDGKRVSLLNPQIGRGSGPVSNEGNRADVALTSSEQELRLLVDTIPTLVWAAGPKGDIEYVNKRVLEYLGATLDEIIGTGWLEKIHPDDVAFKTTTWLANLESRTADDTVCRFRGADGQ